MNTFRSITAAAALVAIAGSASAQFSTGNQAGPFASEGGITDIATVATAFSSNYAGAPFVPDIFEITGTISPINSATWQSEAAVMFESPTGIRAFAAPSGNAGTYAPGTDNSGTITGGSGIWGAADSVGTWNFGFFETFDDDTDGLADAEWTNVDITVTDQAAPVDPPATVFDYGTNPDAKYGETLEADEVVWVEFTISGGAGAQPWSIDTFGSALVGGTFGDGNDSELGLFDAAGNLIASNDDADFGAGILLSEISSDDVGALADGTYYIAAGGFNVTYADGFSASSDSDVTGDLSINVNFVPAPGAAAMLGLGGLVATRRRR